VSGCHDLHVRGAGRGGGGAAGKEEREREREENVIGHPHQQVCYICKQRMAILFRV